MIIGKELILDSNGIELNINYVIGIINNELKIEIIDIDNKPLCNVKITAKELEYVENKILSNFSIEQVREEEKVQKWESDNNNQKEYD